MFHCSSSVKRVTGPGRPYTQPVEITFQSAIPQDGGVVLDEIFGDSVLNNVLITYTDFALTATAGILAFSEIGTNHLYIPDLAGPIDMSAQIATSSPKGISLQLKSGIITGHPEVNFNTSTINTIMLTAGVIDRPVNSVGLVFINASSTSIPTGSKMAVILSGVH